MRLEPKLLSDQGQHEPAYTSFVEERGMNKMNFIQGINHLSDYGSNLNNYWGIGSMR